MSTSLEIAPKMTPEGLQEMLPQGQYPWELSSKVARKLKPVKGTVYSKADVPSSSLEWAFVEKLLKHTMPLGYEVVEVKCIENPSVRARFEANLPCMEAEGEIFPPSWEEDGKAELRYKVSKVWEHHYKRFPLPANKKLPKPSAWKHVTVAPLWRGSSSEAWDEAAAKIGMTFEGKKRINGGRHQSTDLGLLGSGIYHSSNAYTALNYSGSGKIVLSWVAMRKPFPVIRSDVWTLKGGGAYKNFNAHYWPRKNSKFSFHDELVVFQQAQVLPRFIVTVGYVAPIYKQMALKATARDLYHLMDKALAMPMSREDENGLIEKMREVERGLVHVEEVEGVLVKGHEIAVTRMPRVYQHIYTRLNEIMTKPKPKTTDKSLLSYVSKLFNKQRARL